MTALRLRQVLAVFRLELKKSFFSRRGLWIYLLALIPILIVGGHSLETSMNRDRLARSAIPGVTSQQMHSIRRGMTREEVLAILPNPRHRSSFQSRAGLREGLGYSDGREELYVRLLDGKVDSVRLRGGCDVPEDIVIYAGIFQFFYIRLAIFFGCVFVFLNLFRGEMLDKSLHYYFLAPVRREVVVAGKFLAGLTATVVIFGVSTAIQLFVYYRHFEASAFEEYVARGNGFEHALAYVGIAALACVGYGSVFLAAGILIRNPLIPAASLLLWESINGMLPSILRKISVIYYLKSLCPVEIPVSRGVPPPFALLALNVDPASPLLAVGGVMVLSAAVLYFAARRSRRLEINYGTD